MKTIQVILACENLLLRTAWKDKIQDLGFNVAGQAESVAELDKLVGALATDVILFDAFIQEFSIQTATNHIMNTFGDKVAMMLGYRDSFPKLNPLALGLSGCIKWGRKMDELGPAVLRLSAGGTHFPGLNLNKYVNPHASRMDGKGENFSLTDKEDLILGHILKGKTTFEIANDLQNSIKVVQRHKNSIMRKLGARNRAEILLNANWKTK